MCHNLRQLEILELLYMRPGYPVLMEWGWSPFIDNNGERIVNARELHEFLQIGKDLTTWIKGRLEKYKFFLVLLNSTNL